MLVYWIGVAVAAIILGLLITAAPDELPVEGAPLGDGDAPRRFAGEVVLVVVLSLAWPLTLLGAIIGAALRMDPR